MVSIVMFSEDKLNDSEQDFLVDDIVSSTYIKYFKEEIYLDHLCPLIFYEGNLERATEKIKR